MSTKKANKPQSEEPKKRKVKSILQVESLPEKIETLDKQLLTSNVINYSEFWDAIAYELEFKRDYTIKELFNKVLTDADFYKTDRHYIAECFQDQLDVTITSIRQSGDGFTIAGKKNGKVVNMFAKMTTNKGHYEYGLQSYTIGVIVHQKYKVNE